jgi:quinol monooxygenase YgiN
VPGKQAVNNRKKEKMIVAMAKFSCKPGNRKELLEVLASEDGLTKTRAFEGCLEIVTLLDEDPDVLWLYERWGSIDHHKAYVAWRMKTGLGDVLAPIMTGPFEVQYLTQSKV